MPSAVGDGAPAVPVLLGHAVLDRHDRVPIDQIGVVGHHLRRAQRAVLAAQHVGAVPEELGRRRIEGDGHLLPRREPGRPDGLHQQLARLLVGSEVGREAPLVADRGGQAPVVEDLLQGVVGLGAPAQALAERGRADRHDHELLQVDVVVGVRPTVEDVHHRHGQHVGVDPAEVAVERLLELVGRGLGHGQRHAEDGVRAEAGLVVGAVEIAQDAVDAALLERVEPDEHVVDLVVDVPDRVEHALAAEALTTVAQLDRLELPGGRAGRDDGPALGPAVEEHLDLDRGVAPGIEDLASDDVFDDAHGDLAPFGVGVERCSPPRCGGGPRTRAERAHPGSDAPPTACKSTIRPREPFVVTNAVPSGQTQRCSLGWAESGQAAPTWWSSMVLPAGSCRNACRLVATGTGSLTLRPRSRSSTTVASMSATCTAKC